MSALLIPHLIYLGCALLLQTQEHDAGGDGKDGREAAVHGLAEERDPDE
eukprot:CAMPEP_0181266622 /NCGR_PEP_ID=MMETSP1097-20121128/4394_1 /TAXON_ID=35684 /ORGANISM="Pseudopedinella elastica, Strain CCMP716" /LENGTH=48 /DNA_ID= /DNA_START= /DNA_END= /DNA_ORIENTATION=